MLNKIYEKIFDYDNNRNNKKHQPDKICSTINYALAPFEGYYINENIIGLISAILSKYELNTEFITAQEYIYASLFNSVVVYNYYKDRSVQTENQKKIASDNKETELITQTYIVRNVIYNTYRNTTLSSNDTLYYNNNIQLQILNVNDWNSGTANLKTVYSDEYKVEGYPLSHWLKSEKIYDFNKTYTKDNPPIKTILHSYFNIIKNFNIFYVVSNMDLGKCANQIKLIADSHDFLTELSKYDASKVSKVPKASTP